MKIVSKLARRLQFIDGAVPLRMRVPFRFAMQRAVGALEPEMDLLPTLVNAERMAVDIGANRGTYSYALSKLARHVVTFEPLPSCNTMLAAWAAGKNVTVHGCGLGEAEATLNIHVPRLHGSLFTTRASFSRREGDGVEIPVQIRTLDGFRLDNVGFIKIDVEGFEFATLKGAVDTLHRNRPNLLIEIDAAQQPAETFRRTFEWVRGIGYTAHYLDKGVLRECGPEIREQRPLSCNFIFLPVART